MVNFTVNGETISLAVADDTPLLSVLRDHLKLTGTKFGCGISQCGACTVHVDGVAIRSCVTPVSAVANKQITTIEGISSQPAKAIQDAWQDLDVAQCGYCQSGQIMQAIDLLSNNPSPSDDEIDAAMSGNICRCNTYVRIRAAIHQAAKALA